jgi:hypothetical protein
MYKKRLDEWDYRKYTRRQVYENCAEKLEECNGEEVVLPEEELGVHPVPAKQVRRFLKRKHADGGHARNTHSPQSPCIEVWVLQDYADKLIGVRKMAKPTAGLPQKETTDQNHTSSANWEPTGAEDILDFSEQTDFLMDLDDLPTMPQSEVLMSSNPGSSLAVGTFPGHRSENVIIGNELSILDIYDLPQLSWSPNPFQFSFLDSPKQSSSDQSTTEFAFNSEGYTFQYFDFNDGVDCTVIDGTQNMAPEDLDVPAIQEGRFLMSELCSQIQSYRKICNAEAWILICFLSAAYQASGRALQATMGFDKLPNLFRSMAREQNIHMLPAIAIVAVIMEAYGYEYLASQVLQHACTVCDACFGPTNDITLMVRFIVNMLDKERRQFNLKPCDLEDVMCNMYNKFGESHPYFLVTLYNLARAYDIAGHPRKAAILLCRLDVLCQSELTPGHGLSIICKMSLARINAEEGHPTAAVDLMKSAISQCKQSWGENHPYTLECVRRLAMLSESIGATQSIEGLLHQVLQGRRERLGPTHRYTIGSEIQLAQWRTEHAG